MSDVDKSKLRHSVLNDSRVSIISHLSTKAQNISDLDKQLPIDRSTICYHLNILEDVGILKSDYIILEAPQSKGRAGRVYSINHDRLLEAIAAIEELKEELSI